MSPPPVGAAAAVEFTFDPTTAEFARDPFPTYSYLRTHAPVYSWEAGRSWVVTRHEDVALVLRDRRFSVSPRHWIHAERTPMEGPIAEFYRLVGSGLAGAPPDDHVRLRRLVNPAFNPRAIERMRERVQGIVDSMLDAAVREGTVEVRNDFAEMLPIRVLGSILGIPADEDVEFRAFALALIKALNPWRARDELAQCVATVLEGKRLLVRLIELRRSNPADDLLSDLIRAEEAGDRLTIDQLMGIIIGLLIAGSDTTVHGLCFAVFELLRQPDVLQAVLADRALLKGAIDESLRHNPFMKFGTLPRYALEDVEIRGVTIPKGHRVHPIVSAALHDPEVYPDPEVFDMRRDNTGSLVFGVGPHYCLGAPLARLELNVAVGALLDRSKNPRLIDVEPEFRPNPQMRDMVSLRVALSSG
ncbi:hypothetical protein BE20_58495 [Sorangium cellulosum]|uniref:Cytochrome P450 n=1 Tax=Sorangium cellulosum TaxID=56 RepID=A0A150RJ06_SORCE|nr:hypothetical protein BE18_49020 [Sorangium cellulosum]KYF99707.1 hypothetical protein BE20_58495 [Sorangium cellulosum]